MGAYLSYQEYGLLGFRCFCECINNEPGALILRNISALASGYLGISETVEIIVLDLEEKTHFKD